MQRQGNVTKSKEKDLQFRVKEIDELSSKVRNLERLLNFKNLCISMIEKKLVSHAYAKIESLLKYKVGHSCNQRERLQIRNYVVRIIASFVMKHIA